MALTERSGASERPDQKVVSLPIRAAERIFDGALVGLDTTTPGAGRAINWEDPTATLNIFMGVARITAQSGVSDADGESKIGVTAAVREVAVDVSGVILTSVSVPAAEVPASQLGRRFYASDENTFSQVATPGGAAIGYMVRHRGADPANATNVLVDIKLFSADAFKIENTL